MKLNNREVPQIKPSKLGTLLKSRRSMLILGQSGLGKTAIIREYAEENGLTYLDFDLAGRLSEDVAGLPYVYDGEHFRRVVDEELSKFFKTRGEGYILVFDEVNQGSADALNTLYRITDVNPLNRKWAGHDISKAQIVAMGNLSDGTDGTVYLTDLPGPLLNRFSVFQLVADDKDTMEYLKKKYKDTIPQVARYIQVMLEEKIVPRDIDYCLDVLAKKDDPYFIESKLERALTVKVLNIQKGIRNTDPAEMLKNAKSIYNEFKENGVVRFGADTITTEEGLKERLAEFLSDEEIAAVMK